ncbi:MAG: MFS transporter [Alphaproteobacteria bacterium]|jgi:MFS family permease|nr:MFS transporter [Alphaproteobacteria bacterium]
MHSLRTVSVLIAAVVIVQLAQSALAVHIPLAMSADALPVYALGLVAAAYSSGFMAGAWVGPRLLARVGHIRVFAASAAIAAAGALALHWADLTTVWMLVRVAMGWSIALMFAASESWMNAALPRAERGSVIGVYMVCTKAALAAGAFLIVPYAGADPEPVMIAAAFLALAMVPVCFTTVVPPPAPKAEPLALRALFETAPAAVVACFLAGLINGGVLALAPIFAAQIYGPATATSFYAAAWIGSLLLQWPVGKLSDVIDRRLVIAACAGLAALAAAGLAYAAGRVPFWAAAGLYALWGAGALSYYGVAVAHMADRASQGAMARATSGLLFIWASGSILGPLAQGVIVDFIGPGGIFLFAGAMLAVLAIAMLWRRTAREPTPRAQKELFQDKHATSVAAAELSYGERKGEA